MSEEELELLCQEDEVYAQAWRTSLTQEQLKANIELVKYLKEKYKTIEYLIGHYEYRNFEQHPLFLEKNASYRTIKHDPSVEFMEKLRENFKDLKSN